MLLWQVPDLWNNTGKSNVTLRHFRLSKYDPALRDAQDRHPLIDEEWQRATEVGRCFGGQRFTMAEYERAEAKMIELLLAFFDASGLPHLRMMLTDNLAHKTGDQLDAYKRRFPHLWQNEFSEVQLSDDRVVTREEMPVLLKMMMRGFCYIYLGYAQRLSMCPALASLAFVSTSTVPAGQSSPKGYYVEEQERSGPGVGIGQPEVLIDKCKKGDEDVIEEDMTTLAHLSRFELRDALGQVSQEHPFVTYFQLSPAMAERLRHVCDYAFDFDRFDYHVNTYGADY